MDEVEMTIKVKESTHSELLAEKLTGGYKSVDELIVERVLNGNNGSNRATKGAKHGGAQKVDQPGKAAGGDHNQNQDRGKSADGGASSADDFVIE